MLDAFRSGAAIVEGGSCTCSMGSIFSWLISAGHFEQANATAKVHPLWSTTAVGCSLLEKISTSMV
ncbi:hypothetical protein ZHAS_00013191 [Anopheles sinensis]|uniref:Uncharacterized protein n=1 Tax=Anopheles sinensis TaxID=74873 RepID=A0A084W4X2_ANOSI|nr:hypothetical protein ZHAS_00013191 [Anopheles sinensis]